MPIDPQDEINAAQTAPVSNTPDPTTQPGPLTAQPGAPSLGAPESAATPLAVTPQPSPNSQTVTNALTNANAAHPAVQKASLLHDVALALAGGPRLTTSIDPITGTTTRAAVPLTGKQLGMAIALEALSGSIAGMGQRGPNTKAEAAQAGFSQVSQEQQQARAQQEAQAQQDAKQKSDAYVRAASIAHVNAQTIAAVSEAEQRGADAIDKLAAINRASGILDVSPDLLDNNGQPVTQAELVAGMQSGKYNSTDALGPVAGRTEVTDRNGQTHWESTHLVLRDPNAKTELTPEMYQTYADAGVPGFPKRSNIGSGIQIPLRMVASANEVMASHYLADQRLQDLKSTLDGTPDAAKVPASIDFAKPGVATALSRFRYYVSHNADNLADPYLALQQMGSARRNPTTGAMEPNPDAKYVDTIAQTFGGWPVLQAAHNQLEANKKSASDFAVIDSADKANAVIAAPKRFTAEQVSAANNFIRIAQSESIGKAVAEARAHAVATGADTEAMLKTGINPVTKERLTLQNAPDSMLVDPNGNVIPQNQQALYKPTAQERQTADTARQVLAISADLQAQITKTPGLIGPLSGNSAKAFAPFGVGTEAAQKMLDNVSLLQSAVTKMHTGRFSSEILKKSGSLIFPGMNTDQFAGAMDSLRDVAGRYANEDQLTTVADFKRQQSAGTSRPASPASPPPGATMKVPGSDGKLHWSDGKKDLGVVQ